MMRKLILLLGLAASILPTAVLAMPSIVHQPPLDVREGQSVAINAMITDTAAPIAQVRLFYRSGGTLGYQIQLMNGAGYNYSAEIPGSAVTASGVDYYIEARSQNGETATSPMLNAMVAPYHLVAREVAGGPVLHLVAPDDGSVLPPEQAVIVIAIDAGRSRPDLSSLRLIFDEQDVTSQARVSETLLSYVAPESLADGLHGVRVTVRNVDGVEGKSPTWSFTIRRGAPSAYAAPAAKPGIQLSGGVGLETQYAAMTKDSPQTTYFYQPKGWLNRLNLNLYGKTGDVNLAGTAFLTSEETPGRQPVDRVKLEIFDKFFDLSLGDMYPVFSAFSLNNLFVRGGGLSLTSGTPDLAFSQFQVLGGLTRLAIDGRQDAPGSFEQWLWATRWAYHFLPGTGLALNYDTVNDYANSITTPGGSQPADNHAATAEVTIKVPWAQQLASLFYGEFGYSLYDAAQNLTDLAIGQAYRAGMRWEWSGRSYAQVEFKNTGSDYVSLANPWLIGDWRGVAGDAQVFLLDNALAVLVSGNYWHDNLSGQKNFTYLDAAGTSITAGTTTTTTFLSATANYRVAAWLPALSLGCSLNRQQDDSRPSPLVDNQTLVVNAAAGGQIPMGADQILANLSWSQTDYADLASPKYSPDLRSTALLLSAMYLLGQDWSFSAGYGLTSNFTDASGVTAAFGSTVALNGQQAIHYILANAHAAWKAVPGKLSVGAGVDNLAGADDRDTVANNLLTISATGTYFFTPAHSLTATLANVQYDDAKASAKSYGQFIVGLRYGIAF